MKKLLNVFLEDKLYQVDFKLDKPYKEKMSVKVIATTKWQAKTKAVEKLMWYHSVGFRSINHERTTLLSKGRNIRRKQYLCFVNDSWVHSGDMQDCLRFISKYEDDEFQTIRMEPKFH